MLPGISTVLVLVIHPFIISFMVETELNSGDYHDESATELLEYSMGLD